MSDSTASLRRKIESAGDLQSVVRTMKALAASSIGQYEKAVSALGDYYRTVELGLSVFVRQGDWAAKNAPSTGESKSRVVGAVVFGSDQGLVGQFNERIADHAMKALAALPGSGRRVWAVGERIHAQLADAGIALSGVFAVPNSVQGIGSLVGRILVETEANRHKHDIAELYLIHNRPTSGAGYEQVMKRLLPLDDNWRHSLTEVPWPTRTLPEVIGDDRATLRALIREYIFISLFRACAESLASENASRLAAMQRADKNIDDLLEQLRGTFRRVRQSSIDEELFDVVAGFEALSQQKEGGLRRSVKSGTP